MCDVLRPGRNVPHPIVRVSAAQSASFPGEDAPGTGLRHFPEQAVDSSSAEDAPSGFEMRSTAEVYELFEALSRQRGEAVTADDGAQKFGDPEGSMPAGFELPLARGRRRRPGVVNSLEHEDLEERHGEFQMLSAAEVYEMFNARHQQPGDQQESVPWQKEEG